MESFHKRKGGDDDEDADGNDDNDGLSRRKRARLEKEQRQARKSSYATANADRAKLHVNDSKDTASHEADTKVRSSVSFCLIVLLLSLISVILCPGEAQEGGERGV